jgi:DNA phosphorothioation-dependent restriction protein DptH
MLYQWLKILGNGTHTMNLFTETIANYLKSEWERVMSSGSDAAEARFITESLSPESTFELFTALDEHRLKQIQKGKNILHHFRAATGLWREWTRRGVGVVDIQEMKDRSWIDMDDKQTFYRNAICPNNYDALVVILVGLNHASDQGSLSDFHIVNEDRVWALMEQSYVIWIKKFCERHHLDDPSEADVEHFDKALSELFKVRPRRLARLAEFFETELVPPGTHIDTLREAIDSFYRKLAFWDMAPIISFGSDKGVADYVKLSENFISHQNFKAVSEQKKAFEKLEKAALESKLEVPETVNGVKLYQNETEYLETLRAFIFDADADAKKKLLQTDVYQVLKILKKPKKKEKGASSDKVTALSGTSVDVLLQAIWLNWEDFSLSLDGQAHADAIQSVRVRFDSFFHDLNDDPIQGCDGDSLAKELLTGCLGGIDALISVMDMRLPIDEDQSLLPRESWTKHVPIEVELDIEKISYKTSRERPHLRFWVDILATDSEQSITRFFRWNFGVNHPERVRYSCARSVIELLNRPEMLGKDILPAYQLTDDAMTALYFAGDEEEANRLVSQALTEMEIIDLVGDINWAEIDFGLKDDLMNLISIYRTWLQKSVSEGYFKANYSSFYLLQSAYESFAKKVLDRTLKGQLSLLRRFYKAFMLVNTKMKPNDAYLSSSAVWGISPPVLELSDARARFLCDSFPEVVAEHALGGNGRVSFDRLLNLVEIQRPLAAMVVDSHKSISSEIKSFGLLHYFGPAPNEEIGLAVQTLLRDEELDDDVADVLRPTEESEVVVRVLKDYMQLHSFAEDGLRILAVNVDDLATILSGIDRFLREYLKFSPENWQAFQCEVMIYSTSSSPLAVESKLATWRDHVMESNREAGRSLALSVGHHFAPIKKQMEVLIEKERRLYDVAFLMRFLTGELFGETESTLPFEFDFKDGDSISKFPICEYPRPIQKDDRWHRQSLLSNRRLRIQTRHADFSARLRNPESQENEHLVFGRVDYQPWQPVVEALHKKAQWVACIDPFVDKRLLGGDDANEARKIVGFSSGLGAYGELNLSISTEQDTLTQLTTLVKTHLKNLFPFQQGGDFESISAMVVGDAEEIIGLSSLRAVVGDGEKIREVVGFAAIHRALNKNPDAAMEVLLPVDSVMHWFSGSEVTHRPDLLRLSLILREGQPPLINATVIECKLAQNNADHVEKALDQVHDGLSHLTQLFAPHSQNVPRIRFDRRYWWAQLHRAITSRTVVSLTEEKRKILDSALERIAEGYFDIAWNAGIFTFWTDESMPIPVLTEKPLSSGVINPLIQVPDDFFISHIAMGREGVMSLFSNNLVPPIEFNGPVIRLVATEKKSFDREKSYGSLVLESDHEAIHHATKPQVENDQDDSAYIGGKAANKTEGLSSLASKDEKLDLESVSDTANALNLVQSTLETLGTPNDNLSVPTLVDVKPVANALPEKLLIGTKNNGDAVYWHYGHPKLANRHMLIFGASGSGKTYGIQCLLAEMARAHLHSLIVDYTDGFLPNQVEETFNNVVGLKNSYVYTDKLPLNPFQPQKKTIDPSRPAVSERPFDVATRVASIFTSVFSSMGDQQTAVLIRILEAGINQAGGFSLDDVHALLLEEGTQAALSLASKLDPFIRTQPFREGSDSTWKELLSSADHWVNVLQLTGLARDIQKLVTEFALWNLYDYACNTGNKNRPIPLVLDEIQNLDHRSDSPIDKMLREGRKFGLSLILATQTTSQFDQEQRDRLFQAGHKLFFKPASTEIPSFATLLSVATGESKSVWGERLSKLEKGQCWSFGPVLTSSGALKEKAELVSVTALEERGFEVG